MFYNHYLSFLGYRWVLVNPTGPTLCVNETSKTAQPVHEEDGYYPTIEPFKA
jgi:hypothetical protein